MSHEGFIRKRKATGETISYDEWTHCVIDSGYEFYYHNENDFEYSDTGYVFQYCDGEIIVHKPSKKIEMVAADLAERMGAIYTGSR